MAKPDSAGFSRSAGVENSFPLAHLNGYAIMTAVGELSGDALRAEEGSLYPALHRMEEEGWIRAKRVRKDSGRRALIYELTAAGNQQLTAEDSRWHTVTSTVSRILRTV